jgi:hypothetical protein
MIRTRLQPRQLKLAEPFAHRTFRHDDTKTLTDFIAQINAAKPTT